MKKTQEKKRKDKFEFTMVTVSPIRLNLSVPLLDAPAAPAAPAPNLVLNLSDLLNWVDTTGKGIYFGEWQTLHGYAKNFPLQPNDQEKASAVAFIRSFGGAIPCLNPCRAHYEQYLQDHPIEDNVKNRLVLQWYCFNLHNEVNKSTGKAIFTFEQATRRVDFNSRINWTKISEYLFAIPEIQQAVFPNLPPLTAPTIPLLSSTPDVSNINQEDTIREKNPNSSYWWFGLACLGGLGVLLYCSYVSKRSKRKELLDHEGW